MKYFIVCLFLLLTTSSFAKKEPAPKVWSGYLMDKMCSKRMVGNHEKMSKHTKTCLTEESCATSGYGVMMEKKFIPFDAKGNELAAAYLKNSSKENGFQVEVTGSMKKTKIAVVDLTEKN